MIRFDLLKFGIPRWNELDFFKSTWNIFFHHESGRWSLVGSFRSESSHRRLLFKLTNFYLSTLQEREFFSSQLLVNSSAILDLHIKVIWFLHSYSQQFINCQKSRFSFVCNTRAKRAKMLWFCFYTEIELKFYNYILVTFDALIFVRTFIMRTNFQINFGSNCALFYN